MMSHNSEKQHYDSTKVNCKQNEDLDNSELREELTPLYHNEESKTVNETAKSTQITKPKLTFREKLKRFKDNITVEPITACYNVLSLLSITAAQNLSLEKACRVNLNYTDEVCDALTLRQTENYTLYEDEVQILVARIQGWKNIILSTFPLLFILFVGAWSDKTGIRKPLILLPIFGELLASLGLILNTYFFYELPVEVAAVTETIFPALTGGWYVNFIGVFSYIGDITTTENRTYRVGMLSMIITLAIPLTNATCGILLRYLGYYGLFFMSSLMYLFSLLYGYYGLEEPKQKSERETKDSQTRSNEFLRDFLDFGLVAETFKVVLQKGQRNRRLRISLHLCCVFVIIGPFTGMTGVKEMLREEGLLRTDTKSLPLHSSLKVFCALKAVNILFSLMILAILNETEPTNGKQAVYFLGENTILYLFTRYRFNWNVVQFSKWSTYLTASNILGAYFLILLFTKYLKLDDTLICIISLGNKIVASFAYAFARTDMEIYMACLLEFLNGPLCIALRSTATKLVGGDEIGKMNSLFGLAEAAAPLVYCPLYSQVYSATLHVLPGLVFLIGSFLMLPAIGIFVWLYFQKKNNLLERNALTTDDHDQSDVYDVQHVQ